MFYISSVAAGGIFIYYTLIMKKCIKLIAIIIILMCVFVQKNDRAFSAEFNIKEFYKSLSKRLGRTRADYPDLNDKEFANFRQVNTTGISPNKLYRSSSPVKAWGEREIIADNLSRTAGIKTFINLADTEKNMKARKIFNNTYYSTQDVICVNTGLKFHSKQFKEGTAQAIKFMAVNKAPFLVHCDLGKDRAGYFCALLECLTGASAEEVVNDFMVSFYNYFGIEKNSSEYEFAADNEIRKFLPVILGVKSIYGINLSDAAERYFLNIGVSENEINAVRNKLK